MGTTAGRLARKQRRDAKGTHFMRGCALWDGGELRRAFRTFLIGAKLGDDSCQLNVGYFYDHSIGVKRSESKALYWYKRACRRGSASAAANIGLLLKERGDVRAGLTWLQRALAMGDDDAALAMAKVHRELGEDPRVAADLLRFAAKSKRVTASTRTEARRLLAR